MFAQEARAYIEKLIHLQEKIEKKGYLRHDQEAVIRARKHLKIQLKAYGYNTDEKMRGFWDRKRDDIRMLIPAESHRCFKKLMNEFINLQNQ